MSRDGSEEFGRRDLHGPDGEAGAASDRPSRKDPARKDPPRKDPAYRADGGQPDPDPGSAADDATWRELVARLELPSYIDPRHAPWPERENLGRRHAGPAGPSQIRVIRPASGPPLGGVTAPAGAQPDDIEDAGAAPQATGPDDDDRYIPPPLPPLPRLNPVTRWAWTALFGGPGFLLLATVFGWPLPGWAELLAVGAFVGGFTVLVVRLGDGPSRRDGPDQGAVVLSPPGPPRSRGAALIPPSPR